MAGTGGSSLLGSGVSTASGSDINTVLHLRRIYGVNSHVVNNIAWSDESTMVYVACHSIVLYDRKSKKQKFLSFNSDDISDAVTSFTVGVSRKLAAVAEKGNDVMPKVHIFDFKKHRRVKTLHLEETDTSSKEIISMTFSEDCQLLLTLTNTPDHVVMCWNWSKAKLIAHLKVETSLPFYRCSFSPIDASVACTIGRDCVQFYRIAEKDMRILHTNNDATTGLGNHNFVSQCWLRHPEDTLIAGTDTGELVAFQNGEYICHMPLLKKELNEKVTSLLAFDLGFIVGGKNGTFHIIHHIPEAVRAPLAEQFSLVHTVSSDLTTESIVSMSLAFEEDGFLAISADNQLMYISLINPSEVTQDDIVLAQNMSFHGPKSIEGMDICLKKPLIITCSKDSTLRIWNFLSNEVELNKNFAGDEMFSCALHPSGLHAAVGFSDKLRVYHVLVDDIRVCLEVAIKCCKEVKFSPGGHMLAAANGNSIAVFEFATGEKVVDLKGHNSKVLSIHWLPSGYHLVSSGKDGAVYLWDLEGKRNGEFLNKGVMYTSTVQVDDKVFAVGTNNKLLELDLNELTPLGDRNTESTLTHLAVSSSKEVLFASVGDKGKPNSIRAYAYPVTGDFNLYPCASTTVSRMRLTPDESFLVIADEAGCISVLELKDRNERFTRNVSAVADIQESSTWTDEVLLTRADLEEKHATIAELKTKVEELKLHNEYQQKLKEMNYSENIKEVTDKFYQELEQSKSVYRLLQEEIGDCELEYEERRKTTNEQHQNDLQESETDFQAQIMEQVDIYHSIIRDRDAQIERLDEQRRLLVDSHEKYVEGLISDFEKKLEEDRAVRLQFEDERTELLKQLEESNRQLEDDIDTEIEETRKGYDQKLTVAKESTLKYKGENGMLKKKYTVIQGELEAQKEEELSLQEKEKEIHEQIKVLEKEISVHKKDIKARDGTIAEKEKRIYELKKKNQELDKFKFVLDFKIRELKRQIEPRQQEIAGMKERIRSMDEELEKYHKSNANLDGIIGTLRLRINETQDEIQQKRAQAKKLEQTIKGFKADLQLCMGDILDPVKLQASVDKLVATHGGNQEIKTTLDPEVTDEYERHKDFLQKSVQQLKGALENEVQSHTSSTSEMMKKNLELIEEINKQREKNKAIKQSVQAATGRLTHLARVQAEKMAAQLKAQQKAALNAGSQSNSTYLPPASVGKKERTRSREDAGLDGTVPQAGEGFGLSGNGFVSTPSDMAENLNPLGILERNRKRMAALRQYIAELEGRIVMQNSSGSSENNKEISNVLPPLDMTAGAAVGAFGSSEFSDSLDLLSPANVKNNVAK